MGLPNTGKLRELINDAGRDRSKLEGLIAAWNIIADEEGDPAILPMDAFEGYLRVNGFSYRKVARYVQNGQGFEGVHDWFWIDENEQCIESGDEYDELPIDSWTLAELVACPDCYACSSEVTGMLADTLGVDPRLYVLVDVY